METTTNPYEKTARLEKALKIVRFLTRSGIDSTMLSRASDAEWLQIAQLAETKPASDLTKAEVRRMLRARETDAGLHPAPLPPSGYVSIGNGLYARMGRK